jgi:AP-4 complex subunit mu-1
MAKVFKDYCGVLTEESIRKNFILIYELLDEMVDYGYPQITSTEMLKSCIHNEPVIVTASGTQPMSMLMSMNSRSKSSTAANVPVSIGNSRSGKQKNEIYVDVIERLTVLFNASGYVVNSSIDGSIQMKSFLSGNPELRLALNEDLVIGKGSAIYSLSLRMRFTLGVVVQISGGQYGSVVLDDCNFHECVHLDEFETARTLHFIPPDGEFSVLNYRVTADFRAPFRIFPTLEETGPYKLELVVLIRADIPEGNSGTNVQVRIPVPRATAGVTTELSAEVCCYCFCIYLL